MTRWFPSALILLSCLALQAGRKDFWQSKDSSTWTDAEKATLLDQSPWARQGVARVEFEKKQPDGPGYRDGKQDTLMPDVKPTAGGASTVQIGQEIPPVPSTETGPGVEFRVLARWETAKPVRLAGGPEVPEPGGQYYVIRLRGLPLMPPPKVKPGDTPTDPNEAMLAAIRQGSRLVRDGRPSIPCAHLFKGSGDHTNEVLLFFPRTPDAPITVADRFVTLDSRFPPFHLSVRFPLKDMLYKGELSL